jgi:hypothetical protein
MIFRGITIELGCNPNGVDASVVGGGKVECGDKV